MKKIAQKVVKALVLASAVAAVPAAFAQTYQLSGTGTSSIAIPTATYSDLGLISASITGVSPSTFVTGSSTDNVNSTVTGVTLNASNTVTNIISSGGFTITVPAANIVGIAIAGGAATLSNLSYNPTTETISGNVSNGSTTVATNEALFTGTASGPTSITAAGSDTFGLAGITLTAAGISTLGTVLGIPVANQSLFNGVSFGNYTATATFAKAVPEPSTYAILGMGLAALVFAARRKQA